uniref:hypothetical protein n=1 Tax=Castellaniella defragrans TaxID=75697 RepID=UPI003341AC11
MTCRYSNTDWLDVLYNSVRRTSGGVVDAARFLTERRGRNIHPESLRAKLRAVSGDEISLSMADLLTEWMEEKEGGRAYARDWMLAHAAQNGLAADVMPSDDGAPMDLIKAIQAKAMQIGALSGGVLGTTVESIADETVTADEGDRAVAALRELRAQAHRLERAFLRAVKGA